MEESAAEFLAANVVRRRIDSAKFRVVGIVIDRVHGDVACGAPVVTPSGVVGRILFFELGDGERLGCPVEEALKSRAIKRKYGGFPPRPGRAMIQLTVDPQSRLDVRIPRTGARGILRGMGWDQAYSTRIQYVGASPQITAGDLVVTSGVDGRFPPGLPVGRVTAVKDQPGQEPLVTVKPAVDFGKLKRVLVVLSPPPPESAARPRKLPDRLGLVPYP